MQVVECIERRWSSSGRRLQFRSKIDICNRCWVDLRREPWRPPRHNATSYISEWIAVFNWNLFQESNSTVTNGGVCVGSPAPFEMPLPSKNSYYVTHKMTGNQYSDEEHAVNSYPAAWSNPICRLQINFYFRSYKKQNYVVMAVAISIQAAHEVVLHVNLSQSEMEKMSPPKANCMSILFT